MAFSAQGAKFFWSTNATAYTTNTQIGEVTNFSGPGGQAAVIDVTNLQSTAKEKMMGLRDEGELTLTVNYNATATGQSALKTDRAARTKRAWGIKFGDTCTSLAQGKGYCSGFSIAGAVDDKVTANVTIIITGGVTYTTV